MMRKRLYGSILSVLLLATPIATVQADTFGQLLKLFGVSYAVRAFAPQLNELINTLTLNHDVGVKVETKVVPILTIGSDAYVGAAQVSGPQTAVSRVEAVLQVEGAFYDGAFRVKALIPVDNIDPRQDYNRVDDVGISALLDLKL